MAAFLTTDHRSLTTNRRCNNRILKSREGLLDSRRKHRGDPAFPQSRSRARTSTRHRRELLLQRNRQQKDALDSHAQKRLGGRIAVLARCPRFAPDCGRTITRRITRRRTRRFDGRERNSDRSQRRNPLNRGHWSHHQSRHQSHQWRGVEHGGR